MPTKANYYTFLENLRDYSILSPVQKSRMRYLIIYVFTPISIIMYVCVILDILSIKGDIMKMAAVVESLSAFGQLIVRKLTLVFRNDLIEDLLAQRQKFWDYDSLGKDIGVKYHFQMKIVALIFKSMIVMGGSTLCGMALMAFYQHQLPEAQWLPTDNNIVYWIVSIGQAIYFAEIVFVVTVADGMYCLLCSDIIIQFKLLNETFQNIDMTRETCFAEIKRCVFHHRFLIRMHRKLNAVYSEFFIVLFLVSLTGVAMQFYTLGELSSTVAKVKCVFFTLTYLLNVGLVCIPTSNVTTEAENFSNTIFASKWYYTANRKVRQYILFVLMASQKPLVMSAGGLFQVDRVIYILIFRTAFSFSTIMKKGKSN